MITSINEWRKSVNENSKTDFILRYATELKETVKQLAAIQSILSSLTEEEFNALQPDVIKVLEKYDDYLERIVFSDRDYTIDQLVDLAQENTTRKGTEPQFMIFAIEEIYNLFKRKNIITENKVKLPSKGTPEWNQLQIAKKTLKMTPAMANIMGGMSLEDAKKLLKKYEINENTMTKTMPEIGKYYKVFNMSDNGKLVYASLLLDAATDSVYQFTATNKSEDANKIEIPVENDYTFIEIKNPIVAKLN